MQELQHCICDTCTRKKSSETRRFAFLEKQVVFLWLLSSSWRLLPDEVVLTQLANRSKFGSSSAADESEKLAIRKPMHAIHVHEFALKPSKRLSITGRQRRRANALERVRHRRRNVATRQSASGGHRPFPAPPPQAYILWAPRTRVDELR
jgi:hypothetical protein